MQTIRKNDKEWDILFRYRDTSNIPALDNTGDPINSIHIAGDPSGLTGLSKKPRVTIVGTRDAGPRERNITQQIVKALSENPDKPVILSGLAMGIDTEAHKAALECGLPTVAVVATGLDKVYPYFNSLLAERITKTPLSCIVTQFPEKTAPIAINFLQRNKTMALMSDLVIIVASKARGTAIVTARYASEFGIPCFAVPGSPDDPHFAGCNTLISQGCAEMLHDFSILSDPNFFLKV